MKFRIKVATVAGAFVAGAIGAGVFSVYEKISNKKGEAQQIVEAKQTQQKHGRENAQKEMAEIYKKMLKLKMKDPDSVQFRNVALYKWEGKTGKSGYALCGEMNARNSLGGYVGYGPFVVRDSEVFLPEEYFEAMIVMVEAYCQKEVLRDAN